MVRQHTRSVSAGLVLAAVLAAGAAQPARAATAKQLEVVVVERATSVGFPPPSATYEGSAVGSDLQLWSFTESVTTLNGIGFGTFSMQSGADALAGTVQSAGSGVGLGIGSAAVPTVYDVTGGQGAYAGCTGSGTPIRQSIEPPPEPAPNETVVETISFGLTCS